MLSLVPYSIAAAIIFCSVSVYSLVGQCRTRTRTSSFHRIGNPITSELFAVTENENDANANANILVGETAATATTTTSRRQLLKGAAATTADGMIPLLLSSLYPEPARAAAAEEDVVVLQRCDVVDPRCGADGKLRDTLPAGNPIPRVTNRITHVVQLVIDVGERREEVGFIRFGLYGDDCPESVKSMIRFLTTIGITGMTTERKNGNSNVDFENSIDTQTSPVTLLQGGIVPAICPNKGIEFGVPSQKKAYARARGLRAAGDNFVPQNRPQSTQNEASARKHDVAGLISIPEKGIGYYNNNDDVDAAFASAFLITANDDSVDSSELFDKKLHRRVIGQVIDDESMEFLARLASLPIQKKGVGGNKGSPPLLKVTILDAGVQKVGATNTNNDKNKKKK